MVALSRPSAASEIEEPIAVDYSAAPGCESRDDFVRDVLRRTPKARLGTPEEAARRFEVSIAAPTGDRDGAYAARLVVHGLDGTRSSRSVSAETCAQATRALALMVALSIDPHARAADEPLPPDASPSPSPVSKEPPPRPAPPADDSARAPAVSPSADRSRLHAPWSLSVGADAEGLLLIESRPVFAVGGHVELARPRGFSLRASLRRTLPVTVTSDAVGGRFVWTWARLDGCPVRFGDLLDVRPCVLAEIGEIDATGVGGRSVTQRGRPWATAGLMLRLTAHLGHLTASGDVAVAAPINRESFVFDPSPLVYRIPAWIGFSGLALAGDWNL
jgi:hypothetical protein